jgi:hypothetical protein
MFEKLPRHPIIRRFLMDIVRRARLMRKRYRDAGYTACEVRGIKLLREWLSPQQLVQFNKHRYFEVTGCHTGRKYRIRYGRASNIWELDPYGQPKTGWCVVPSEQLVPGDVMLAQKIGLETDERTALAVARSFRPI